MITAGPTETDIRHDEILERSLVCETLKESKRDSPSEGDRRRRCFATGLRAESLAVFNQLSLSVLNRSSIPVLLEMVLSGETNGGEEEAPSLFSGGREILLPGQRRDLKFPSEAFGFCGRQRAWRDITRIEVIFKKEKTDAGDEPIDIDMGPIYGERRSLQQGPRLTDAGISLRLREDTSGTPSLHGKSNPIPAPHPHFYPKGTADEILGGYIMGHKVPFPIPWDSSPDGTQEWTHFLNRHHFLRPVLQAFIDTGDINYAKFIEDIVCRWVMENPVPLGSNGGAGPSWETLSVAWRLREWLWIRRVVGNSSFPGGKENRLILRSLWEHCRHLMDHQGHPNNWIILEAGALALAGMELPEFKEASSWQKEGLSRLKREISRQFLPEGAHFELSPFYHALCLHILLEIRKTAASMKKRLPTEFNGPLKKAADYLAAICRPDFTWPSLNDSGSVTNDYSSVMRLAGDVFGRADFTWIGTKGKDGKAPRRKIRVFRSAGIAVMRSGSRQDADYLLFRAGPAGASHAHEDVLSLDIAIAGVSCLVDPGITAYAPGPLTDYYRSAIAHNMILIEDKGPVRAGRPYRERIRPADNLFLSSDGSNGRTISGCCRDYEGKDGGADIAVTRIISSGNRRGWVVTDSITGSGNHRVTVCWQFAPGNVKVNQETGMASYENGTGTFFNLTLLNSEHKPKVTLSHGNLNPPLSWVSIQGRDIPTPHLQYSFDASLPFSVVCGIRPV
ncbi:MAG: alginate lyase family protein, partial [Syntrophales bacterium]|nr:alginate lyase family protein [Syntrophales bacterium]